MGWTELTNSEITTVYKARAENFTCIYIFWFLFDAAIVNSFILWKNFSALTYISLRQQSLKFFRLSLANALVGGYNSRHRYGLPASISEASKNSNPPATKRQWLSGSNPPAVGHFPIKGTRGRCAFCWNFGEERHETCVRNVGRRFVFRWPLLFRALPSEHAVISTCTKLCVYRI